MLESILSSLGFDIRYFVFNFINFVLIAFLLYKFFFKKLIDTMQERQKLIDDGIENKLKYEELVKSVELEKNQILHNARVEASRFIEEKKKFAFREAKEIVAEATAKAKKLLDDSRANQVLQQKEFLKKLKVHGVEAIVETSKKLHQEDVQINK